MDESWSAFAIIELPRKPVGTDARQCCHAEHPARPSVVAFRPAHVAGHAVTGGPCLIVDEISGGTVDFSGADLMRCAQSSDSDRRHKDGVVALRIHYARVMSGLANVDSDAQPCPHRHAPSTAFAGHARGQPGIRSYLAEATCTTEKHQLDHTALDSQDLDPKHLPT
jgi:hypothetical protein